MSQRLSPGRGCNYSVPPQEGNRISLGYGVRFEIAHDLRALLRVDGDHLAHIERVEKPVGDPE